MTLITSQTAPAYGERFVHNVSVYYARGRCVFSFFWVAPRPPWNRFTSNATARRPSLHLLLVQARIVCASSDLARLGAEKICFTQRARAWDETLEVKTSHRPGRWRKRLRGVAYESNDCRGISHFGCFVLSQKNI